MPAFWIEMHQNGSSQTYPFDAQMVTFGRDQSADFVLDHPTVSRQHGRIMRDMSGGYKLQVLSQGGLTAVNGQRVQGEVPIYNGSSINFGQIQFVFRTEAGAPQQAGGFGQQPGFGAPPGGGGFGAPPGGGGFGAPPGGATGGFDAQPAAATPTGSQGAAIGFGPAAAAQEAAVDAIGGEAASHWEAYASSMEEDEEEGGGVEKSTFEKMNDAAAKNQEGGVNPLLIILTLIAVGFMGYTFIMPTGGGGQKLVDKDIDPLDDTLVVKVECISKEDCLDKAKDAYKVGVDKYKKRSVEVSNLFESFKKMREVEEYLAAEGLEPVDELKGVEGQKSKSREELDGIFRDHRRIFHTRSKTEMYDEMANEIFTIQSFFPDKNSPEYKWAEKQRVSMVADGTFPEFR